MLQPFLLHLKLKDDFMNRKIVLFLTFISVSALMFSCGHGTCVCRCSTSGKTGQNYDVGNVSLTDASGKCNALKTQYDWDTCITTQEKP